MLSKKYLYKKYSLEGNSVNKIATDLSCSENKINYWLKKYNIKKRDISSALYLRLNPEGDPFKLRLKIKKNTDFLYGLGLGLFWGEGNKKNKNSVRLGNTDPDLIKLFILFVVKIYNVSLSKFQFSIQVFDDMDVNCVRKYWIDKLGINPNQIYKKITVTKSGKIGTYKEKSKYGVITVYINNTKLKKLFDSQIVDIRKMY